MLKNYFKTALRNIKRNRAFAILNILGLVIGISGAIIIYRIVSFENSFDQYHTDADRVNRIVFYKDNAGNISKSSSVMHPLGPAIAADFPEWEVSRIHWYWNGVFKYTNDQGVAKKLKVDYSMAFVEQPFFNMFDFDVLAGNPDGLLTEQNSIAMSASAADKIFGTDGSGYQDLLGKTIEFENALSLILTGVYADPPENTDWGIHYLMSYEGARIYPYANGLTNWGTQNGATRTFVKYSESETLEGAQARLIEASENYLYNGGYRFDDDQDFHFTLQPVTKIHLDEELGTGRMDTSVLRGLSILAVILVLTAAINFINLATAQSVKRAKEIGIRKVLGSAKIQLVVQFLGEVFLITSAAIILSLGLSEGILLKLEPFLGYQLSLDLFQSTSIYVFLLALAVGVTLLAGAYPAMVLSGFTPLNALRSSKLSSRVSKSSLSIRRALVIFQFFISQTLIIGTLVVLFQMNFMINEPLGFKTEGILTFNIPEISEEKVDLLRSRVSGISGVEDLSFFIATPGAANTNNLDRILDPRGDENDVFAANRKNVDENYADLFNLELVAGEFIKDDSPEDHVAVNEKLVQYLGIENSVDAVGTRFETNWGMSYLITGVVKDFHNQSFRSTIDPVYFLPGSTQYFEGGVGINTNGDYQQVIDQIEKVWTETYPESMFSHVFVDDRVKGQYETEQRIAELFEGFAAMAVLICCLGLYGLVSFMANQKVKEIGIRKVLGASIGSILRIFSKEVMILVGLAFLISAPLSYYVMNFWLNDYAYRIDLGAKVFILGAIATSLIAAVTVGTKAVKAASANPVNSLKDE